MTRRSVVVLLFLTSIALADDAKPTVRYFLPWPAGKSYKVTVGNQQEPGHNDAFNGYAWDFFLPEGSDISAVADGVVTGTKDDTAGPTGNGFDNNFVEIEHADGSVSMYHHIMQHCALVKVGDHVLQGDIVAKSGKTGAASGPHLHFARKAGKNDYNSIPTHFADVSENDGVPVKNGSYTSKNVAVRSLPAVKAAFAALTIMDVAIAFRWFEPVVAEHQAVARAQDPGVDTFTNLKKEVEAKWKAVSDQEATELAMVNGDGDFAQRLAVCRVGREQYAKTPWEADWKKALDAMSKDPAYKDALPAAEKNVEAWKMLLAAAKEDVQGHGPKARSLYDAFVKKYPDSPFTDAVNARLTKLAPKPEVK